MKLRIRGDSIRMRVSQAELEQITAEGRCADRVRFPGGAALEYGVEVVPDAPLAAELDGGRLTLRVPRAAVDRWAGPEEVSISGEQTLDDGARLSLLLEKDFACLVPRAGEEEADLFPNPQAGG